MMAAKPFPILADDAKPVDIAVAWPPPIDELDAKFERALRSSHEFWFIELDQLIVFLDCGDGRFADTDRADRFAFDEFDIVKTSEKLAEQRSRHPTGCSSPNDQDFAHRFVD